MKEQQCPDDKLLQKLQLRIERLHRICRIYKKRNKELLSRQQLIEEKQRDLEAALKESQYRLGRINSEVGEELETAQRIQEGLLPEVLPETVNLKCSAIYIPAGKVGGDLYDIIITPRQKTAILIFDVSGHGIPAALIGAMAKMLFARYLEKTDSPAEVFYNVNKDLCNFIKTEQYLTAFLGVIDPIKNIMTYSRAGHVPPLLYHAANGQISKLDAKGFFIGHTALLPIVEYTNDRISLNTNDKLLFYTDGLTEAYDRKGKFYGGERLKNIFSLCGHKEVKEIIEEIVRDQKSFRDDSPLRDDFTILCVEVGDSDNIIAESGFRREDEPSILLVNNVEDIDKVCAVVLKEMDHYGYTDQSIKQFKICIFEMITNAIIHGNKNNPKKKVMVFYRVTEDVAIISVLDEGEGFDFTTVPDPLLPENRLRDHGRGLFLIKHYMDEVSFNKKGNRIMGKKFRVKN
ncbi:MAG: SpoIIE family protein phosphatase [Chitinispirillaceae bacterium]|nr:SpoIIE family protein phosphatase [Chitinispirillaceae bacterium]